MGALAVACLIGGGCSDDDPDPGPTEEIGLVRLPGRITFGGVDVMPVGEPASTSHGPRLQAQGGVVVVQQGGSLHAWTPDQPEWTLVAADVTLGFELDDEGTLLYRTSAGAFVLHDVGSGEQNALPPPPGEVGTWQWSEHVGRVCAWTTRDVHCHDLGGSGWTTHSLPEPTRTVDDVEWLTETTAIADTNAGRLVTRDGGETWEAWEAPGFAPQHTQLTRLADDRVAAWGVQGPPLRIFDADAVEVASLGSVSWLDLVEGGAVVPLSNQRLEADALIEWLDLPDAGEGILTVYGSVGGSPVVRLDRASALTYLVLQDGVAWLLPDVTERPVAPPPLDLRYGGAEQLVATSGGAYLSGPGTRYDPDRGLHRLVRLDDVAPVTPLHRMSDGRIVGFGETYAVSEDEGESWQALPPLGVGGDATDGPFVLDERRLIVSVRIGGVIPMVALRVLEEGADAWVRPEGGDPQLTANHVVDGVVMGSLWSGRGDTPACYRVDEANTIQLEDCPPGLERVRGIYNERGELVRADGDALEVYRDGRFRTLGVLTFDGEPVFPGGGTIRSIGADGVGVAFARDSFGYRTESPIP